MHLLCVWCMFVRSLFSLSLLIITGLRARISLSAGQPCHISSKQAPSLQKALDNSPQPWPLKQKAVLLSFFQFLFRLAPRMSPLSNFSLSFFLSFLFFSSAVVLSSFALFPPLFVRHSEGVFCTALAVKVSVMGKRGDPDKNNRYVVFSYSLFKARTQSCSVLIAVNNSVSNKPAVTTPTDTTLAGHQSVTPASEFLCW